MERRGDGVSIIFNETRETAGAAPTYRILDESNLVLTIPAARLELTPSDLRCFRTRGLSQEQLEVSLRG